MIFTLTLSICSFAQGPSVVSLPQYNNGYLLLNKIYHPEIVNWNVTVSEVVDVSGASTVRLKDDYTISNNHLFFEDYREEYFENLIFEVLGFDIQGDTIVEEGPFGVPPGYVHFNHTVRKWDCISKTYAYTIRMNTEDPTINPNAGQSKMFTNVARPLNGNPWYYQWIQAGPDWDHFVDNVNTDHYELIPTPENGIYGFNPLDYLNNPFANEKIIRYEDVTFADGLYNEGGYNVTGIVYGVYKSMGVWNPGGYPVSSVLLSNASPYINYEISGAINTINQNYSNWTYNGTPQLDCFNYPDGSGNTTGGGDVYNGWANSVGVVMETLDFLGDGEFDNENVTDALDDLLAVYLDDIRHIKIISETTVQDFDRSDFISENGDYIGFTATIDSGLNVLQIQLPGGNLRRFYFDVVNSTTYTLEESEFLSTIEYPNPLTGNSYKVNWEADANIRFDYHVYDNNGNVLYQQNVSMREGYIYKHTIAIPYIPVGLVHHRYTFGDGSVIEKTTIKQ